MYHWKEPRDFAPFQTQSMSPIPPYWVEIVDLVSGSIVYTFSTPEGIRLEQLAHYMAKSAGVAVRTVEGKFTDNGMLCEVYVSDIPVFAFIGHLSKEISFGIDTYTIDPNKLFTGL